jgi:hypothetical protein
VVKNLISNSSYRKISIGGEYWPCLPYKFSDEDYYGKTVACIVW